MSENYFQHADHFTRVLSEQNPIKNKFSENLAEDKINDPSKEQSVKEIKDKKVVEI